MAWDPSLIFDVLSHLGPAAPPTLPPFPEQPPVCGLAVWGSGSWSQSAHPKLLCVGNLGPLSRSSWKIQGIYSEEGIATVWSDFECFLAVYKNFTYIFAYFWGV